jgi:hypothetical protein
MHFATQLPQEHGRHHVTVTQQDSPGNRQQPFLFVLKQRLMSPTAANLRRCSYAAGVVQAIPISLRMAVKL